jgi:hypothetical protein
MFPRHLLAWALLAIGHPATAQRVAWRSVTPTDTSRPVPFRNPRLRESSALTASRTQPGVLWTLNDSGDQPLLYATDTLGRDLGMFLVTGATNTDWEAMASGPCPGSPCLYIGDLGDNSERRRFVAVFRVAEPEVEPGQSEVRATAPARSLTIRYPDRPHDAEALVVTPTGDLLIITKGRDDAIHLYRIQAAAWSASGAVTAEALGDLPIAASRRQGRRVTDAALAPEGRRLVVRTYSGLFFFQRPEDDRLVPSDPPLVCETGALQLQGEGVEWLSDGRLALSSEAGLGSGPGSVLLVRCPTP